MKLQKLLIIGTLPEASGIGGVTIHIKRLLDYLDSKDYNYDFIDYRRSKIINVIKEVIKHRYVHVNLTNIYLLLTIVLLGKLSKTKVIVTKHGNFSNSNYLKKNLFKIYIKLCSVSIVLNNQSFEFSKKYNKRSILISAFIPPVKEEELPNKIKSSLLSFVRNNNIIFATNASSYAIDDKGNEIYGIKCLIQIFENNRNWALVISDPKAEYRTFFIDNNIYIPENILIITERHSFYEVLKLSDGMIRNTSTDGDSLSIKEALFLHKRVFCSKVVSRPKDCVLFKYNESKDIELKISEFLELDFQPSETIINGAEDLLNLYKHLDVL